MYVERYPDQTIRAVYGALQPGMAEEWMDEDDPALDFLLRPPPLSPRPTEERLAALEAELAALKKAAAEV